MSLCCFYVAVFLYVLSGWAPHQDVLEGKTHEFHSNMHHLAAPVLCHRVLFRQLAAEVTSIRHGCEICLAQNTTRWISQAAWGHTFRAGCVRIFVERGPTKQGLVQCNVQVPRPRPSRQGSPWLFTASGGSLPQEAYKAGISLGAT